ncbi:MAG: hypothetical protein AW12_02027 [Candidatus Accumulibacter sp. BA-94]|nr:MAG: hypothetical protein AW12_02027 [Candidatus Accumulibacter sp. BA-94]
MEIRRKPRSRLRRVRELLWKPKYEVFAMYRWISRNWASERLVVFHYPIKSDNMPITGFPVKYELQGGWTIPKADLQFLTKGPLASERLHSILVPASLGWRYVFELFRQVAPVFTIAGGSVTVVSNWSTVKSIFLLVANAL